MQYSSAEHGDLLGGSGPGFRNPEPTPQETALSGSCHSIVDVSNNFKMYAVV